MQSVASMVASAPIGLVLGDQLSSDSKQPNSGRDDARDGSVKIKSVIRREETTLRLGGLADNFHMSWALDDRQFVSANDGTGWLAEPKGLYNSRLFTISGGPEDAQFRDVVAYPDLLPTRGEPRYYAFGNLALDGRVYLFLSTFNSGAARRFIGAKLIYSPDDGRSWCNQDGSPPVAWEDWTHRSRDTMVFFEEDQEAFSMLSVLQMGRNYEFNRDGYAYVYAPNGNTEGTMNELVMFRVPKAQILNRVAYEYFAGLRSNGEPLWSSHIDARKPAHVFPSGWVNKVIHPFAWLPSVVYNKPLGLYMMANWATGPGPAPDREWFQKPSYLGFWIAQNPWGPWTQIHEETAWLPSGDVAARCFSPIIAPKWIAADGKSLWLVWSDFQTPMSPQVQKELQQRAAATTGEQHTQVLLEMTRNYPNYQFNVQRVDLITA